MNTINPPWFSTRSSTINGITHHNNNIQFVSLEQWIFNPHILHISPSHDNSAQTSDDHLARLTSLSPSLPFEIWVSLFTYYLHNCPLISSTPHNRYLDPQINTAAIFPLQSISKADIVEIFSPIISTCLAQYIDTIITTLCSSSSSAFHYMNDTTFPSTTHYTFSLSTSTPLTSQKTILMSTTTDSALAIPCSFGTALFQLIHCILSFATPPTYLLTAHEGNQMNDDFSTSTKEYRYLTVSRVISRSLLHLLTHIMSLLQIATLFELIYNETLRNTVYTPLTSCSVYPAPPTTQILITKPSLSQTIYETLLSLLTPYLYIALTYFPHHDVQYVYKTIPNLQAHNIPEIAHQYRPSSLRTAFSAINLGGSQDDGNGNLYQSQDLAILSFAMLYHMQFALYLQFSQRLGVTVSVFHSILGKSDEKLKFLQIADDIMTTITQYKHTGSTNEIDYLLAQKLNTYLHYKIFSPSYRTMSAVSEFSIPPHLIDVAPNNHYFCHISMLFSDYYDITPHTVPLTRSQNSLPHFPLPVDQNINENDCNPPAPRQFIQNALRTLVEFANPQLTIQLSSLLTMSTPVDLARQHQPSLLGRILGQSCSQDLCSFSQKQPIDDTISLLISPWPSKFGDIYSLYANSTENDREKLKYATTFIDITQNLHPALQASTSCDITIFDDEIIPPNQSPISNQYDSGMKLFPMLLHIYQTLALQCTDILLFSSYHRSLTWKAPPTDAISRDDIVQTNLDDAQPIPFIRLPPYVYTTLLHFRVGLILQPLIIYLKNADVVKYRITGLRMLHNLMKAIKLNELLMCNGLKEQSQPCSHTSTTMNACDIIFTSQWEIPYIYKYLNTFNITSESTSSHYTLVQSQAIPSSPSSSSSSSLLQQSTIKPLSVIDVFDPSAMSSFIVISDLPQVFYSSLLPIINFRTQALSHYYSTSLFLDIISLLHLTTPHISPTDLTTSPSCPPVELPYTQNTTSLLNQYVFSAFSTPQISITTQNLTQLIIENILQQYQFLSNTDQTEEMQHNHMSDPSQMVYIAYSRAYNIVLPQSPPQILASPNTSPYCKTYFPTSPQLLVESQEESASSIFRLDYTLFSSSPQQMVYNDVISHMPNSTSSPFQQFSFNPPTLYYPLLSNSNHITFQLILTHVGLITTLPTQVLPQYLSSLVGPLLKICNPENQTALNNNNNAKSLSLYGIAWLVKRLTFSASIFSNNTMIYPSLAARLYEIAEILLLAAVDHITSYSPLFTMVDWFALLSPPPPLQLNSDSKLMANNNHQHHGAIYSILLALVDGPPHADSNTPQNSYSSPTRMLISNGTAPSFLLSTISSLQYKLSGWNGESLIMKLDNLPSLAVNKQSRISFIDDKGNLDDNYELVDFDVVYHNLSLHHMELQSTINDPITNQEELEWTITEDIMLAEFGFLFLSFCQIIIQTVSSLLHWAPHPFYRHMERPFRRLLVPHGEGMGIIQSLCVGDWTDYEYPNAANIIPKLIIHCPCASSEQGQDFYSIDGFISYIASTQYSNLPQMDLLQRPVSLKVALLKPMQMNDMLNSHMSLNIAGQQFTILSTIAIIPSLHSIALTVMCGLGMF